ncbi:MAG: c-type cytochrome domain-containing protein [Opitutaceae bacterium]|nr:c-type cytochrome domain-containing protein [Opitutaceae bacterium]
MNRLACAFLLSLGSASAATPDATIFAAHIQPIFADYCVSCHGEEKSKGRLRLDSLEQLLKGGESGPAFVVRDSARSALVERLLLPADDEDHMPPRDKPQPAPELVQLLRWWIDQGADPQARVAGLKVPAALAPLFAPREILRPKPRAEVQAALAAGTVPATFAVRFVSLESGALHASSSRATDADIERLLAVRENLTVLDLTRAPITDRAFAAIGRLTNLQSLRLDHTGITDAGAAALAPLQQLTSLNLNGTRVTDQGLEPLRRLKALRKIYLWETAVTAEGVKTLQASLYRAAEAERLRLQIAALEHTRDALRVEIVANASTGPEASEAEAPKGMTIAEIMKAIHEGKNSKAQLAPQGKLSDDDLNQMLELYGLMAGLSPPQGDKAHFQALTHTLIAATKGLLAKTPGADDEFKQAVDCKSCHAQHRAK